jgi:hypothetical protein
MIEQKIPECNSFGINLAAGSWCAIANHQFLQTGDNDGSD